MTDFRKAIDEKIRENRPNLGASSVKTYVSILSNLHKNLKAVGESLDWFNHEEKEIMDFLSEKPSQTRKSVLSALFVLTGNDAYRKLMLEDCGVVNAAYKEQKKSTKESENWISTEQIQQIYNGLLEKVQAMFKRNMVGDYPTIMQFWLVALLGGVAGIPPRRSLDYGLMKIRGYDPKTDNFYKAGRFYFNRYKTADKYGLQVLDVPKDLQALLRKWMKINDSDYLLFSSNKRPLSSPQINRILNKVFDKRVSVDMLRHIYLTNHYKDMPSLKDMETLAADMGHSVNQQMLYVKKG
jgi:integrase